MKNCINCKNDFEPSNKRQKFCSDTCRKVSHAKKVTVIAHTVTQPKVKPTQDELQLMYPQVPAHLLSRYNNIEILKGCLANLSNDKIYPTPRKTLTGIQFMIELKTKIYNASVKMHELTLKKRGMGMGGWIKEHGEEYARITEELDDLIVDEAVRIGQMKQKIN